MTICSAHDSEVCYESRDCPACAIADELKAANDEIAKLEQEIKSLEQAE